MRIPLRLYRNHDPDLLALYKNPNFSFQKALKGALRAYINKEPYFIYQPEQVDLRDFDFKYGYQFFLIFDDFYDKDIIDWLNGIKKRQRNIVIKSILRGAMVGVSISHCMEKDDDRIQVNAMQEKVRDRLPGLNEPPLKRKKGPKKSSSINSTVLKAENNIASTKTTTNKSEEDLLNENISPEPVSLEQPIKTKEVKPVVDAPVVNFSFDNSNVSAENTDSQIASELNSEYEEEFDLFGDLAGIMNQF